LRTPWADGTMARPVRTYPFRVELAEADYLALLKAAPKGKPLTRSLVAAEDAPGRRGRYHFQGSHAEGLLLRTLALVSAPAALPAINRALAAVEKAER
jgi:hypothetical protein